MLYLKALNEEDIKKEWSFLTNLPEDENGLINPHSGVSFEDFVKYDLPLLYNCSKGIELKEGYVPQTYYFLWEDKEIIGLFKFRHYLNDTLYKGSGHIGYTIKHNKREQGYGTKGLGLMLEIAKTIIPEEEVFMSANKNNIASLKVMLNNGAYIHHEDENHFYTRIKK
ncbi:MAG: GNAT family N-acetyltransferase [Sphaerochaetaceae bacterium]|nr:GNAT family N-acetyltransferase [Sphaerochaetaceae bacterium]